MDRQRQSNHYKRTVKRSSVDFSVIVFLFKSILFITARSQCIANIYRSDVEGYFQSTFSQEFELRLNYLFIILYTSVKMKLRAPHYYKEHINRISISRHIVD